MFILEELFCSLDDFCLQFEPAWRSQLLSQGLKVRNRSRQMSLSEIMTILIAFHQSYYRNFKHYYLDHVCVYWTGEFPRLPSYQRFVEWMPSTLLPLCVYLKHCFGRCTGISFIDATSIKVCHNRRIPNHRVFQDWAKRGKTSVDWFAASEACKVVVRRRSARTRCASSFISWLTSEANYSTYKLPLEIRMIESLSPIWCSFFSARFLLTVDMYLKHSPRDYFKISESNFLPNT